MLTRSLLNLLPVLLLGTPVLAQQEGAKPAETKPAEESLLNKGKYLLLQVRDFKNEAGSVAIELVDEASKKTVELAHGLKGRVGYYEEDLKDAVRELKKEAQSEALQTYIRFKILERKTDRVLRTEKMKLEDFINGSKKSIASYGIKGSDGETEYAMIDSLQRDVESFELDTVGYDGCEEVKPLVDNNMLNSALDYLGIYEHIKDYKETLKERGLGIAASGLGLYMARPRLAANVVGEKSTRIWPLGKKLICGITASHIVLTGISIVAGREPGNTPEFRALNKNVFKSNVLPEDHTATILSDDPFFTLGAQVLTNIADRMGRERLEKAKAQKANDDEDDGKVKSRPIIRMSSEGK